MKISIIIPTFNSEDTIENAVHSIILQSNIINYEIICIDDGSTDSTWSILLKLANKYDVVKCFRQQNQKQAAARNNGLDHATGEYVMFMDADDSWQPELFMNIKNCLGLQLTIFGIIKRYKDRDVVESKSGMRNSKDRKQLIQDYLSNNLEMDVGVWNKVFSSRVIKENNLSFSNGNFFEDSLFVLDYLICIEPKNIIYIEKPFYVLNKHENTTTSLFSPDILERANQYLSKVGDLLITAGFSSTEREQMVNALTIRLSLHISHHYMLHSGIWSSKWENVFLRNKVRYSMVFKNTVISKKYKLAILLLKAFPRIYRLFYFRYKPQL